MAAAPQVIALNCQLGDGPPGSRLADGTPGGGDSEVAEVPEGDGSGCLGTAGGPGTRLADSRWRSYPARPDQVARVRALLAGMLGDCPAAADVILMADELVTNAVLHSRSHEPGGTFRLRILISDGDSVRIEVADAGGEWASRAAGTAGMVRSMAPAWAGGACASWRRSLPHGVWKGTRPAARRGSRSAGKAAELIKITIRVTRGA